MSRISTMLRWGLSMTAVFCGVRAHAQATLSYAQDGCSIRITTTIPKQDDPNKPGQKAPYRWYVNNNPISTIEPTVTILTSGKNISKVEVYVYSTSAETPDGLPLPGTSDNATFQVTPNTTVANFTSLNPTNDPNNWANSTNICRASGNSIIYADAQGWIKIAQPTSYGSWNNWYLTSSWNSSETCQASGAIAVSANNDQVFYVGNDRKIQTYYWVASIGWQHAWLTRTWNNNENATLGPDAITVSQQTLLYVGQDGWIHQYYYDNATQAWQHKIISDTSDSNGLASCNESSQNAGFGIVAASKSGTSIFYRGADKRLHTYFRNGSGWSHDWMITNWNSQPQTRQVVTGRIVTTDVSVYYVAAYPRTDNRGLSYSHVYGWRYKAGVNAGWKVLNVPIGISPATNLDGSSLSVGTNDQLFYSGSYDEYRGVSYRNSRLQSLYLVNSNSDYVDYRDDFSYASGQLELSFLDANDPRATESTLLAGNQIKQGSHILLADRGGVFYVGQDNYLHLYYRDDCSVTTGTQLRVASSPLKPGTAGPPPVTTTSQIPATSLVIFPNPTSKAATLSYQATSPSIAQVRVTNSFGASVYERSFPLVSGANQLELNTCDLASGLYVVTVSEPGKQTQHQKFIVAK